MGLGICQVDVVVGGVVGRKIDAQETALTTIKNRGNAGDRRLLTRLRDQPEMAILFRDDHAAIRQESDAPGLGVEIHDLGHGEGQVGCRLLFAHVGLG
jgi:hypothetical protein